MGLSVAYGIIANHGGFIDATSAPHEATTFKTYLPIWESPHRASDKEVVRIKDKPVRFEGDTILFVEDEPRQLQLMRKVLEQEGFRVLTAVNGTEAVEIHLQHKDEISVAVLDLGLPGMSGWEAMKKMKQVDGKLKFVLATGYLSPEVESEVAGDDRSTIIMKPYQLDEIVGLISSLGNKSNR